MGSRMSFSGRALDPNSPLRASLDSGGRSTSSTSAPSAMRPIWSDGGGACVPLLRGPPRDGRTHKRSWRRRRSPRHPWRALISNRQASLHKQTPRPQNVWDWRKATRKIACAARREGYPHPPMPTDGYLRTPRYRKTTLAERAPDAQHANTGNADLERVAGNERSDAGGVPVAITSPGHQRHDAGNPPTETRAEIISEVVPDWRRAPLTCVSTRHIGWIESRPYAVATGQKVSKPLPRVELNITLLQIARGNVVKTSVDRARRREHLSAIAELPSSGVRWPWRCSLAAPLFANFSSGTIASSVPYWWKRAAWEQQRFFRDFV